MMSRVVRRSCCIVAVLLALDAGAVAAQALAPHPTSRLAWMAGCWEQHSGTRLVEEHWLAPRAGVMLGLGRTVRGDTLREYEFTRIYARGDTLVYAAQPSGQPAAEFRALPLTERAVTFENLSHDFPQRVIYRAAAGQDSLLASIEGSIGGQTRRVDFPYARVACPGLAAR
jgi:hypothetical protein